MNGTRPARCRRLLTAAHSAKKPSGEPFTIKGESLWPQSQKIRKQAKLANFRCANRTGGRAQALPNGAVCIVLDIQDAAQPRTARAPSPGHPGLLEAPQSRRCPSAARQHFPTEPL